MPDWFQVISKVIAIVSFILLVIIIARKQLRQPIRYVGHFFLSMVEEDIKSLLFPYIRNVSASAIIDGKEEFLVLSVYFPTSILGELKLTLTGELIMNGMSSFQLETKEIKISNRYVARLTDWKAPLTKQLLVFTKQAVSENNPTHIVLRLWDVNNKQHEWQTEEWTTLLLTRVN